MKCITQNQTFLHLYRSDKKKRMCTHITVFVQAHSLSCESTQNVHAFGPRQSSIQFWNGRVDCFPSDSLHSISIFKCFTNWYPQQLNSPKTGCFPVVLFLLSLHVRFFLSLAHWIFIYFFFFTKCIFIFGSRTQVSAPPLKHSDITFLWNMEALLKKIFRFRKWGLKLVETNSEVQCHFKMIFTVNHEYM